MVVFLNLLTPPVLFFMLGFCAKLLKSDLHFPENFTKILAMYLLISIGLHGGVELREASLGEAAKAIIAALSLGTIQPFIAYYLFRRINLDRFNAAALAAHYGSVSVSTFLSALAFLKSLFIFHEKYPVIMLAVMESPAIIIGLWLAKRARILTTQTQNISTPRRRNLLFIREALTNSSVVLVLGGIIIGLTTIHPSIASIKIFYADLFMAMLCLFLLIMGLEAATQIQAFKKVGIKLSIMGVIIPLLGGIIGIFISKKFLLLSPGGSLLVAMLGASASYIAAPAAVRFAIPEANPSYYLTLSLGVTFTFNVLVGIPFFHWVIQFTS